MSPRDVGALLGFMVFLVMAALAGALLYRASHMPLEPAPASKPRYVSPAEKCAGACYPLVVSRFVGPDICECASRDYRGNK